MEESLKVAKDLKVLGPYDVKVSEVDNYNLGNSFTPPIRMPAWRVSERSTPPG